jgi:hypothetical protein
MLHFANFMAGGILLLAYVANAPIRGINPLKWNDTKKNRIAHEQLIQENRRNYKNLWTQLFGAEGLADTDKDGNVSFNEAMDTFQRAGCVSYDPISIRQPNITELQTAVNSYKK